MKLIGEENNLFKEKAKGPSNMLDELRKKLGFVDKSTETSYEDSLSIENKLTKNLSSMCLSIQQLADKIDILVRKEEGE